MAQPQPDRSAEARPDSAGLALQRLKLQFQNGLGARAAEIEAAATLQQLHNAVHRLAGAAGIYGDTALYEAARQMLVAMAMTSASAKVHETALELEPPLATAVQQLCALCRKRWRSVQPFAPHHPGAATGP